MTESTNKAKNHRYFLDLSFDGTDFLGWQVQPKGRTVQGLLIEKLSAFFREEVYVIGAGRTDTGVHASQMIAHFDLDASIENPDDVVYKLNRFLPHDVAIRELYQVNVETHARFSAEERAYTYRMNRLKDPFEVNKSWWFGRPLNFEAMNECANLLLQYSDFACFCKADTDVKTTLCEIRAARWEQEGPQWVFHIRADRFLRNMVRAIVGTLVEVGEGKHSVEDFKKIIESGSRSNAGASAPAGGLYLSEVRYPEGIRI